MLEGHSVQGSKSEVTARHHQDLTFEWNALKRGLVLPQVAQWASALSRDFDIGKKNCFCNLRM